MDFVQRIGMRYCAAGVFLLLLAGAQISSQSWVGDFWVHAAVVRELATHLLTPQHPQLLSPEPHMLYSPYAVLVAIVARTLHLSAMAALSVFAILNLLLLLGGLRVFCGTYFQGRPQSVSFYALVLILFFWGNHPWFWSSFVHMDVLPFVLPYPSVFALGLTLWSLALWARWTGSMNARRIAVQSVLVGVLLLTHPLTGILYIILATAIVFQRSRTPRQVLPLIVCLGLAAGLAILWPYYPFLTLLQVDGQEFHDYNKELYKDVMPRVYPLLLASVVLVFRLRKDARDALAWTFVMLILVYAYGGATDKQGYGRTLAHAAILVQLALAPVLARIESAAIERRLGAIVGLVIAAGVFVQLVAQTTMSIRTFTRRTNHVAPYEFLEIVDQYDVVLSTPEVSWHVPALGGKVIAVHHPVYLIEDLERRRADARRFFEDATFAGERRDVLRKYGVDYILVPAGTRVDGLTDLGTSVARTDAFELLRVAAPQPGSP